MHTFLYAYFIDANTLKFVILAQTFIQTSDVLPQLNYLTNVLHLFNNVRSAYCQSTRLPLLVG